MATLALAAVVVTTGVLVPDPLRWWLWGGLAATYLALVGLGASFISWEFFGSAICRGSPGGMRVSLTFDDGPDSESTPRLLEVLAQHQVKATFFLIGRHAERHPQLVQTIAAKGHLVGNHTYRHAWWTNFLWGDRLDREIQRAQQVFKDILGTAPRFFRSPMGLTNPHLSGALKRLGLRLVGWDLRGLDQRAGAAAPVIRRLSNRSRDGSIILLHDGGANPQVLVDIVQSLIPALRNQGFAFVRLDEFLASPEKERFIQI
ncbi:MAG: polysaccharide deacetylase family protein [Desulfobaccales bacterium]